MNFEFATPKRIIFGNGKIREIGALASSMGRRVLLVTGSSSLESSGTLDSLDRYLIEAGVEYQNFKVSGEPELTDAEEALGSAQEMDCDMVIAVGGGSVIDLGKAVSVLMTNIGDIMDYIEVIGRGQKIMRQAAPFIAAPTTAGTGAEVTKNAVLKSTGHGVKASIRSPLMIPAVALVDPELTYSMPLEVTASTGLDALTQLIEPYVSRRAGPYTDALIKQSLPDIPRALDILVEDPLNPKARQAMALGSLFGGLALANAGLGAVHGFAGPLGGSFPIPHGIACASLLPYVIEANVDLLADLEEPYPLLIRYGEIGEMISGQRFRSSRDGIKAGLDKIFELQAKLKVPKLSQYGLTLDDVPDIVDKAKRASSMKANPVEIPREKLSEILIKAMGT